MTNQVWLRMSLVIVAKPRALGTCESLCRPCCEARLHDLSFPQFVVCTPRFLFDAWFWLCYLYHSVSHSSCALRAQGSG